MWNFQYASRFVSAGANGDEHESVHNQPAAQTSTFSRQRGQAGLHWGRDANAALESAESAVPNLQMRLPGMLSPAIPPLPPSPIALCSTRVPQIRVAPSRVAHELLHRTWRFAVALPTASSSDRPLPNVATAHSLTDSADFNNTVGRPAHRRERSSWAGP
jgi:hypothetical protein